MNRLKHIDTWNGIDPNLETIPIFSSVPIDCVLVEGHVSAHPDAGWGVPHSWQRASAQNPIGEMYSPWNHQGSGVYHLFVDENDHLRGLAIHTTMIPGSIVSIVIGSGPSPKGWTNGTP